MIKIAVFLLWYFSFFSSLSVVFSLKKPLDIDLILANIDSYPVKYLRDSKQAIHPVRKSLNFSMEDNQNLVTKTGHNWCGLVRDTWACIGEEYEQVLRDTEPFNNSAHNLKNVKPGTRIYADGNSYLAEFIYTIVCESDELSSMWKLGWEPGNSLLVYYNETDVAILLIDNEKYLSFSANKTLTWLDSVQFRPDIMILGANNHRLKAESHAMRTSSFTQAFPQAILVSWLYNHLPCGCSSNFCRNECGHQCFPGPMARGVEFLVDLINFELSVYGRFK